MANEREINPKEKLKIDVYDMWRKLALGDFSEDTRHLVNTLLQHEMDQALDSYKECAKNDNTGKGEQLEHAFCVAFTEGVDAVSKVMLSLPVHAWFEFDNKDNGEK